MDTSGRLRLSALGAAKRRRDGRFRAWHRHERLTVAMVLSAALHHIAQRPRRRVVGRRGSSSSWASALPWASCAIEPMPFLSVSVCVGWFCSATHGGGFFFGGMRGCREKEEPRESYVAAGSGEAVRWSRCVWRARLPRASAGAPSPRSQRFARTCLRRR